MPAPCPHRTHNRRGFRSDRKRLEEELPEHGGSDDSDEYQRRELATCRGHGERQRG